MVKKIKYLFIVPALLLIASGILSFSGPGTNAIRTVVIDAGHGGKDPGCQGAMHKEKDVSLSVALRLGKFIEENLRGVKVVYTRTTDVFVELEDRAQIANKAKADLFISIHCNAAGKPVMVTDPKTGRMKAKTYRNKKGKVVIVETSNPVPYGTETYVMGLKNEEGKMKVATRENSAIFLEENYEKKYGGFDPESEESYIIMSNYTSAYVIQSASLAMKIQEEYSKKAGRVDKGVHRQSIWVLWRTSMPSILTEIGYLTNPLEEQFLGSEKGQDYLAKALFRGLRRYKDEVEGAKKEYNDEFENLAPLENENIKAGNLSGQKKTDDEDAGVTLNNAGDSVVPVPAGNGTIPQKDSNPPRQKINDSKYVDIPLNPPDNDTALTAKDIANRYKKDQQRSASGPSVKTNTIEIRNTTGLVFKVQFASSDVALNLKQERFSAITDADFYKTDNVLKYTSGKFASIKDATAHQLYLREKGFKDCFIIAVLNGKRIDMAEARKMTGQ